MVIHLNYTLGEEASWTVMSCSFDLHRYATFCPRVREKAELHLPARPECEHSDLIQRLMQ
jgi:hypothetical protein